MALVTLRSFRDPISAELTRALLESRGIRSFIFDENVAGIQWLYSYAIGGVKVKVEADDLAAAREALADASVERGVLEGEQTATPLDGCPVCGSLAIGEARTDRLAGAASLLAGFPLVARRWRWHCRACGHTWRWHPAAEEPVPRETLEAEALVHEEHAHPLLRIGFALLVVLAVFWFLRERILPA